MKSPIIISCIAILIAIIAILLQTSCPLNKSCINDQSTLNSADVLRALGYSWHPIISDTFDDKTMISISITQNGTTEDRGGATHPQPPLYLIYKIDDSHFEYSIIGKNGGLRSSVVIPNGEQHSGTISFPVSGTPIKIDQVFCSIGTKSASIPPSDDNIGFSVTLSQNK